MRGAWWTLTINTFAFTICFAAWMMNGVLITFLVDNGIHDWDPSEMGWLIGIPVLTGAVFRLPLGVATDKWGGRLVFGALLLIAAVPMYLTSYCNNYWQFFIAGLGFGFTGASFAVGIAYTSVWFPKQMQGTALGIFGAGNAGAALTSLGAPHVLNWLTSGGENLEGWRNLPRIYSAMLIATGILFLLTTTTRLPAGSAHKSLSQRLQPLKHVRVWRFGLYYFFVFGGFVALAQWLVPYYVNAYAMSVAMAGALAACNSLPSGVIRAAGGWMSDKWGARAVMYWVFGSSLVCCALLIVPQMDIRSPGSGKMAMSAGEVVEVSDSEVVIESAKRGRQTYQLAKKEGELVTDEERRSGMLILPRAMSWQEPVVEVGQTVKKKELVARGVTHIFFQANVWIFTALSLILGAVMGIGKAAVYKHIPDYFPNDVGVVGGIVGVLGGLGGFICPVIFGYLLRETGLWTSCWMFFFVLIAICLIWMHVVVQRMLQAEAPQLSQRIE
ncbi:MAG: NarK/NasA family nitrate transporter [Planctomycetota bacterium]|nr:MAG: NarK/NasA family nitrate transporter [Planctomycetota bacterium]REJ96451.1 MAG: NarK/NasA family nitrate transporter [Planctomycetota bacterium]REK25095.1 MAG: NarK/NasA family nitrate transporter [Planctomycetota bacterium]REK44663.1 MAG: NarK/NasA family nitrate transporter [Planctomycetota bacterium]